MCIRDSITAMQDRLDTVREDQLRHMQRLASVQFNQIDFDESRQVLR